MELGGSDWADLKEVGELRRGDRRAVNEMISFETSKAGGPLIRASLDDDMRSAVLQRVVENWSLPLPLPGKAPASLDLLTIEQDDALSEAVQPHLDAIRGRSAPVKENEDPTVSSPS